MSILAIDQGTTSTRALLADADGKLQLLGSLTHSQHYPAPGYVEHDGEELLANVAALIGETDAKHVGLDNQGESCLAWDATDGKPISPVIVWQDDRTADIIAGLEAENIGAEVMARAGLPLDAYFSASKLGWIMRHIPRARELAALGRLRLGTTDAFFRDRLTGRFETDIATASRTSLLDLEKCQWNAELCRIFGVPIECLPQITATSGDLGRLADGKQLAASIVDQQAALYGHGCTKPGEAKITFGTGAFAQSVTGALIRPDARHGPLPTIAWKKPGEAVCYALDGGVYAAAAAVNWAREIGLFSDYSEINAFNEKAGIERGLAFIPALAGLGCPHWNRAARGAFMGLSLASRKQDMMQALLEGIALRSIELLDAMQKEQTFSGPISIDGGLSRNEYFIRFLAETANCDFSISEEAEVTALGLVHMIIDSEGLEIPKPYKRRRFEVAKAKDRKRRQAHFQAAVTAVAAFGSAPSV